MLVNTKPDMVFIFIQSSVTKVSILVPKHKIALFVSKIRHFFQGWVLETYLEI